MLPLLVPGHSCKQKKKMVWRIREGWGGFRRWGGLAQGMKRLIKIYQEISCDSLNIIYLINCTRCNKQGVGECKTPQKRLKSYIKAAGQILPLHERSSCALIRHFQDASHSLDDLQITLVDKLPELRRAHPSVVTTIRNKLETRWIHLLQAELNIKVNWHAGFPGNSPS